MLQCRYLIEDCIGESAGPIMDQDNLGKAIISIATGKDDREFQFEEQRKAFYKVSEN